MRAMVGSEGARPQWGPAPVTTRLNRGADTDAFPSAGDAITNVIGRMSATLESG